MTMKTITPFLLALLVLGCSTAGNNATDNNVALCNALVDELGDGRVTPKRHVVPLIASGKPDALSLCDALVDRVC